MSERLFDDAEGYDGMLHAGLSLSGEEKHYFIQGRVDDLVRHLPAAWRPQRVLDFGCGLGDTCAVLAAAFPGAEVVGADVSEVLVRRAEQVHGSPSLSFCLVDELGGGDGFDLCYVNGTFHHIPRPDRATAVDRIRDALRDGGYLALFDNNPWNLGARLVMRRIPFDREARMLSAGSVRRLLKEAGFSEVRRSRYLFYFPRVLAPLRPIEPRLSALPLGAQYHVLARK